MSARFSGPGPTGRQKPGRDDDVRNTRIRAGRRRRRGAAGGLISFVPILLIFVIMYFLMIRPQQKKVKEHKAMVEALRRGDQVVTSGGLIGKVTKVADGEVEVELRPERQGAGGEATISQVVSKTEPAEA